MEPKGTHVFAKPHSRNNSKYVAENDIIPIKHNLALQLPPQREKTTINKNASEIISGNVKIKTEINKESKEIQTDKVIIFSPGEYDTLFKCTLFIPKEKNDNNMNVIYVSDDDEDAAKTKVNNASQLRHVELYEKSQKVKMFIYLIDKFSKREITLSDIGRGSMLIAIYRENMPFISDQAFITKETTDGILDEKSVKNLETYSDITSQAKFLHDFEKQHQKPFPTSNDVPIVPPSNNNKEYTQENPLLKNVTESGTYLNTNYQAKLQQERPKIQQYSLENKTPVYDNNNLITHSNQYNKKDTEIYPNMNYQALSELQKFQHMSMQSTKNVPLHKNETLITSDAPWMQITNNATETLSNFNQIKVNQGLQQEIQHHNPILRAENYAAQRNTYDEQHDTSFMTRPIIHGKDKYKMKTQPQYTSLLNLRNKGHKIFERPDALNNEFQQQAHPQYSPYNSYVNRPQMYQIQQPPTYPQQHQQQYSQQHLQQYPQQYQQKYQQQHPQNHQCQQFAHQFFQQPKQPEQQQQPHLQQQSFQQQNYFY